MPNPFSKNIDALVRDIHKQATHANAIAVRVSEARFKGSFIERRKALNEFAVIKMLTADMVSDFARIKKRIDVLAFQRGIALPAFIQPSLGKAAEGKNMKAKKKPPGKTADRFIIKMKKIYDALLLLERKCFPFLWAQYFGYGTAKPFPQEECTAYMIKVEEAATAFAHLSETVHRLGSMTFYDMWFRWLWSFIQKSDHESSRR